MALKSSFNNSEYCYIYLYIFGGDNQDMRRFKQIMTHRIIISKSEEIIQTNFQFYNTTTK